MEEIETKEYNLIVNKKEYYVYETREDEKVQIHLYDKSQDEKFDNHARKSKLVRY